MVADDAGRGPDVDWCFDSRVAGARDALEREVAAHLARHAVLATAASGAMPLVSATLDRVAEASAAPLEWVSLVWEDSSPQMTVRAVPGAGLEDVCPPGSFVAPGLFATHEHLGHLSRTFSNTPAVTVGLPVSRAPERDIDPAPVVLRGRFDRTAFTGAVASVLAAAPATGHTTEEAAATAGVSLGHLIAGSWTGADPSPPGSPAPRTAAEVAEAFVEAQRIAGGDFFVVEADERRAVLGNRACPFGAAVQTTPDLCRVTSGLMGTLASRCGGEAHVTLGERLALGDHQCRIVVELGEHPAGGTGHAYHWPPSGLPERSAAADGAQINLALRLPRDRLSVPLVRHLTRYAMDEVGVIEEHIHDVQLAVTEATANVLDHSGPGDVYEVTITIGERLCEIRVVDLGHGFDQEGLTGEMPNAAAERGRGIALMHALMDQVRFTSEPERGTVVHLVKVLEFSPDAPGRRLLRREDEAPSAEPD